VYTAPPWDKRDPVPYSIGRIVEFLSPEDLLTRRGEASRKRDNGLRIRVAWFYRPTDVQDKGVGDHRLLLAALFSEIIPFSYVRGKCIVRHRDKITDLVAYKKKEDRFYFYQLFDPFTKDNYEVMLSTEIHNCAYRLLCSTQPILMKDLIQCLDILKMYWCPVMSSSCANEMPCRICKIIFDSAKRAVIGVQGKCLPYFRSQC
jgi:hypothetical protein